jgi:cyclophilin family peptidyl-prolyl cis-trans isomerase
VKDEAGVSSYFVIETAIVMDMPHAIDHFIRMVEKKLWDGLALVHEPNSKVITATPVTMDDSHRFAGQRFIDANLTHMAFNEYSPTYPPPHHKKFSVAFSGRPGGPSFYINLDDDVEVSHEHESIFGVVLEGRDVLYKLYLQKQAAQTKKMLTIQSIEMLETKKLPEDEQS